VRTVREGERLLNDGKDLAEVLRTLEISEATWNRWRARMVEGTLPPGLDPRCRQDREWVLEQVAKLDDSATLP
jgi:hypothetical protein